MIISGDAKLIAAAFVKARGDMNATVIEDGKGNYGKYATLAAIVETTTPHLAKHGLAVIQEASADEHGIVIETWLVHESGSTMQFTPLLMPLTDKRPQAVGSAITYGRRYALAAICGLAPDDDDGQAAQDAQTATGARNGVGAVQSTQKRTETPQRASTPVESDVPFTASAEQLAELEKLGKEYYRAEWQEQRGKLAEAVSKGAVSQLDKLNAKEAAKLIAGLVKRLEEAQVPA